MEHHADFAVPVAPTASSSTAPLGGRVLALGWWDDRGAGDSGQPPTGTLYLVADEALPRPLWSRRAD